MRLIEEIIRTLLKLVCNIDSNKEEEKSYKEVKTSEKLNEFIDMIDEGKINEAENILFDSLTGQDRNQVVIALEFYTYLNDKEDDFLVKYNYSREEIVYGIKYISKIYGYDGITGLFLN